MKMISMEVVQHINKSPRVGKTAKMNSTPNNLNETQKKGEEIAAIRKMLR